MVNRRSFLKLGAATVAGSVVNLPVYARGAMPTQAAFQQVVFDERYTECQAFANAFSQAGVATAAVRGDVAELWYGGLRSQLSQNRLPIAGLTDRAALFCLEELARDVNMRVTFRVDHVIDQMNHVEHSAVGPVSLVTATANLTERTFGRAMAGVARGFDKDEPRNAAAQKRTGPLAPANKVALVSWIVA